jgi:hypothetical protein
MTQSSTPLPPTGPRTSTNAIISLIGGITGLTILPTIGSLAGVIFGHIAKKEIKNSGGTVGGNGLATWGLVLGYIGLSFGLCACIIVILSFAGLFTIPFLGNTTYY